jgi:hypothetical protein
MGSGQRTSSITEAQIVRAAAWDQVSRGELAFDFTPPAKEKQPRLRWAVKERVGVKEAILRWLEQQM